MEKQTNWEVIYHELLAEFKELEKEVIEKDKIINSLKEQLDIALSKLNAINRNTDINLTPKNHLNNSKNETKQLIMEKQSKKNKNFLSKILSFLFEPKIEI